MEKQFRYLQLNESLDTVIGESYLLGEIDNPVMVLDQDRKGSRGDKYNKETGEFTTPYVVTYDIDITEMEQEGANLIPVKDSMYYVDKGKVYFKADCLFKGNINTSLELPLSKTPIIRYANNSATHDEIYGSIEIQSGKLTGSVELPYSGDWRVQSDRINRALETFGIDWKVEFEDIHLIV